MKKLLHFLRLSASGQPKQNRAKTSTVPSRSQAEKMQSDVNSEIMPGRLFDYYGRVLYRPTDLTERLK